MLSKTPDDHGAEPQSDIPTMRGIFEVIRDANPEREAETLNRRCWKLLEELGEVAEAFLNVTSQHNGKAKSLDDLREELADVLIVAVDIAFTPMGGSMENLLLEELDGSAMSETPTFAALEDGVFEVSDALNKCQMGLAHGMPLWAAQSAVDAALLAADIAMTALPDRTDTSYDERLVALAAEVTRKLAKWAAARDSKRCVIENVQ